MTRTRTMPGRTRRSAIPWLAVSTLAAATLVTGCAADGPPDGWRMLEDGDLTVAVDDSWVEPDLEGEDLGMWTVVLQDTDSFTSSETQVRFVAAPDFANAQPGVTDTYGAESALEYVVMLDPFGETHPVLPDPVQISGPPVEVWRQDAPRGSEGNVAYLWAAHDEESGRTVVAGLGGEGLTEDMVDAIDSTLTITPEGTQ